jgi:hypothetical protein
VVLNGGRLMKAGKYLLSLESARDC